MENIENKILDIVSRADFYISPTKNNFFRAFSVLFGTASVPITDVVLITDLSIPSTIVPSSADFHGNLSPT